MSGEKDTKVKFKDKFMNSICAFIPGKVSNKTVVGAYELMRKLQKVARKDFSKNLEKNINNFAKHEESIRNAAGYVEDQNSYTDMAYGKATMQYSGCEIFATYNAIYNILGEYKIPLSQMISEYEKDGMALSGMFGTAPKAIRDYLEKKGFITEFSTDSKKFNEIGEKHQSLILTMYNDGNDIRKEVHTVNISKSISKEGTMYVAHNVYCNGRVVGPFNTVSDVIASINHGKAKGISLIGVSKN